ncbi:MAG TPA: hypothetical protein VGG68_09265 [Caulobacteraceae bacterium]|jgi:hypothetical protein
MAQLWNELLAQLAAPFVGQLDLIHLFLLVGLVLVFAAAWVLILNHVVMAGAAVAEAV